MKHDILSNKLALSGVRRFGLQLIWSTEQLDLYINEQVTESSSTDKCAPSHTSQGDSASDKAGHFRI